MYFCNFFKSNVKQRFFSKKFITLKSLEVTKFFHLFQSGRFFKKINFFVLAFNQINLKNYKSMELKSTIFSL